MAQTSWYNSNGYRVGKETYYPTSTGTFWFDNNNYLGNRDFACLYYAWSRGVCHPYGPAGASFSPTGNLYVLKAF